MKQILLFIAILAFALHSMNAQFLRNESSLWLMNDSIPSETENIKSKDLLNFNYPLKYSDAIKSKIYFKNSLQVYMVIKNDQDISEKLADLENLSQSKLEIEIFNDKTLRDNNEKKISNIEKGSIIRLKYANLNQKRGRWILRNLKSIEQTQIYEIIVFPKLLDEHKENKIETYLSLKYGVYIEDNKVLVNSVNDTLISKEKWGDYYQRLAGLAQDISLGLSQKQGMHIESQAVAMAFHDFYFSNDKNKTPLPDFNFYLWGDNGENLEIDYKQQTDDIAVSQRTWRFKAIEKDETQDSLALIFKVKAEELSRSKPIDKENFNNFKINYSTSEPKSIQNFIYPDSISKQKEIYYTLTEFIDQSSDDVFFNIVDKADLEYDYEFSTQCNQLEDKQKLSIKINKGQAPFSVRLEEDETLIMEDGFDKHEFVIEYTMDNSHQLIIKDALGNLKSVDIHPENYDIQDLLASELPKELSLTKEKPSVSFNSKIKDDLRHDYEFTWYDSKDKIVAKSLDMNFTSPDTYTLVATSKLGCEYLFKVNVKSINHDSIKIFPNPVNVGETFEIELDLLEPQDVNIYVYSNDGRLLKSKFLKQIKTHSYFLNINNTGVYQVLITTQKQTKTLKAIVK